MSAESRDVPDTFARFHARLRTWLRCCYQCGRTCVPCLAKARSRVSISLQVSCWPVFVQREGTSAAVNNTLQVFRSQRWGMRVCTHACSALRLDRPLRSVHFVHHAATTQTGDGDDEHHGHLVGRRQEGLLLTHQLSTRNPRQRASWEQNCVVGRWFECDRGRSVLWEQACEDGMRSARSASARARSGEPWGGVLLCLYVCRCALCVYCLEVRRTPWRTAGVGLCFNKPKP